MPKDEDLPREPADAPATTRRARAVVMRPFAGAMLGTALGLLPVLAVGALAALIRRDLSFSEGQLGLATATFFASSALCSVPAGTFAERLGPTRSARWAVGLGALALLGIASLAVSWLSLLPWLVIGGAGNALAQVATNGLIAEVISASHNGIAFGVKQSAGPLASLLLGVSIPLLGLTVGWRWTFACAAVLCIPAVLVLGRGDAPAPSSMQQRGGKLEGRRRPLMLLAVSAALGAGAVNCLNAFYVESAVSRDVDLATAGLYFAFGGMSGIVVRVIGGWWSDRAKVGRLTLASIMLAAGAASFVGLAAVGTAWLLPATVLAFGTGWGWNGLVLASVVDAYPEAPSAATSVTQAGLYLGAVVTPIAFGFIAQHAGYPAAWSTAGLTLLCASLFLLVARAAVARA